MDVLGDEVRKKYPMMCHQPYYDTSSGAKVQNNSKTTHSLSGNAINDFK